MLVWKRAANYVSHLVFPQGCLNCQRILPPNEGPWCLACAEEISTAIAADYCPYCGSSAQPHLVRHDGCPDCQRYPTTLDGIARVGPYDSAIGVLVRNFKYQKRQYLDKSLGKLLAASIRRWPWADDIDAIIPVPTGWLGRLRYQFYPVRLIARATGREWAVPVLPLVYVQGKKRRQIELSATERAQNVRGVFHLHRHTRVTGTKVCIIDDVCTTGSTLREIARVLRKAGAAGVYAAVLAKTPPEKAAKLTA